MPRYFFSTTDGTIEEDTEGTELPDVATARREGIRYAGACVDDQPSLLRDGHQFHVEVTDEARILLFTINVSAVDAPGPGDIDQTT